MADGMAPSAASTAANAREALQAEALQRLQDARQEKSQIDNDLQNCFYYAAPRRVRRQSSQAGVTANRPGDDRQLQTSFGFEVVDDFMSMLIETFTPREGPWAERRLPTNPDEDGQEDDEIDEVNDLIAAEDAKIFDLIRSSNYYAEKAKAGVPDAAIGVIALTITDPGRGRRLKCLGVPIRELDLGLGPDGMIDFRSITRNTRYRHLRAELGEEVFGKLPNDEQKKVKDSPDATAELVWAWWRNWDNAGDVEWKHVVMLNTKVFHDASMTGEGSCPLIVGRFGATPDFAWPDGPLIKSLPDLVGLDETRAALIENLDFTLRPPKAYEDDGTLNMPTDGIRPGELYPKRASGGQSAFEDIYTPRPIDSALFEVDHLQMRIKRLHYVDVYEQRGKTPPTATQWVDELAIRQRRIGTPGYAFWREEPFETFQRFRYLGEKRGRVTPLSEIAGIPIDSDLTPYNPAERAADLQEISTAVRFAEIGQAIAPTMWQAMIDEGVTLENLQKKFRDKIVKLRPAAEAEQRIKLLASLGMDMLGKQGGGPAGGGQQQ